MAVGFRSRSAVDLTEKGHFDFVLAHWHVIGFMHVRNEEITLVRGYKAFAKNPATPEEFSIFVCQK